MESDEEATTTGRGGWRDTCIQTFGLLPLPAEATQQWQDLSKSHEKLWERYYRYRIRIQARSQVESREEEDLAPKDGFEAGKAAAAAAAKGDASSSDEDDVSSISSVDDDDEEEPDLAMMESKVRKWLQGKLRKLAKKLYCRCWEKHVCFKSIQTNWSHFGELRSYHVETIVFSPYAIPHALQLRHNYQYFQTNAPSPNMSALLEFSCSWKFQFICFGGKGRRRSTANNHLGYFKGDSVTKQIPDYMKRDDNSLSDNSNYIYDPKDDMELLCSNGLKEPPAMDGSQQYWHAVQDIHVRNFTPATVARLRAWLLGNNWIVAQHNTQSNEALLNNTGNNSNSAKPNDKEMPPNVMSNFDFVQVMFASFGCPHFETHRYCRSGFGHCWRPEDDDMEGEKDNTTTVARMIEAGMEEKIARNKTRIPWLEYQARLVTGALRLCDHFYQPYNEMAARQEWGEKILDAIRTERLEAAALGSTEELKAFRKKPWLIWDAIQQRQQKTTITESADTAEATNGSLPMNENYEQDESSGNEDEEGGRKRARQHECI